MFKGLVCPSVIIMSSDGLIEASKISEGSPERKLQLKQLAAWEELINQVSAGSARVSVQNDVDLEGPPTGMTYITELRPAPGIVIPDDPPMGCECKGSS